MTGAESMKGSVGILNVGAGDTKLIFDRNNPAECIRAARIVKDMIRRGYALLIEVEKNAKGEPVYQRATDFDENTSEYIIADFDPVIAAEAEAKEAEDEADHQEAAAPATGGAAKGRKGRPKLRRVDAAATRAVAVAHSAGG
jgi:hypothetical protein